MSDNLAAAGIAYGIKRLIVGALVVGFLLGIMITGIILGIVWLF